MCLFVCLFVCACLRAFLLRVPTFVRDNITIIINHVFATLLPDCGWFVICSCKRCIMPLVIALICIHFSSWKGDMNTAEDKHKTVTNLDPKYFVLLRENSGYSVLASYLHAHLTPPLPFLSVYKRSEKGSSTDCFAINGFQPSTTNKTRSCELSFLLFTGSLCSYIRSFAFGDAFGKNAYSFTPHF